MFAVACFLSLSFSFGENAVTLFVWKEFYSILFLILMSLLNQINQENVDPEDSLRLNIDEIRGRRIANQT